jgi:soluble lytic murein transglycosylase-like protein
MTHATRKEGFARKAGGILIAVAHGVLIAGGLTGMASVEEKATEPTAVSFIDTRTSGPFATASAPGEAEPAAAPVPAVAPPMVFRLREPVIGAQERVKPKRVLSDDDLSPEMARVRDWIAGQYRVSATKLEPALAAAEEAGAKVGIDPLLIVAIMGVESSFNARAVSNMGAQGLMQVIPKYHQDKIGARRGGNALFDPEFNVHVGTQVLHEGLRRYGSLQRALQYYNGSLTDPNARYTRKVLSFKKRLLTVAAADDA